jgi:threonine/homoserine/homoserine lactone efflux protein
MRRVFADAVVLNILNPKTAVFFLAFVPQFVEASVGDATTQLLVLGCLFIVLGLISDGAYALSSAWVASRLARGAAAMRRANLVAGTGLIGLAVVTATSGSGGGRSP